MLSSVDSTCKSTPLIALTKSASAEDPLLEQYDRHELIPPSSLSATRLSPSVPLSLPLPLSLAVALPLSCNLLSLCSLSHYSLAPFEAAASMDGQRCHSLSIRRARARFQPPSLPSSNERGRLAWRVGRCYRCGGRDGARAMTRAASPSSKPNLSYMPCHLPALSPSLPSAFARSFTLSLCSTSSWASGLSRPSPFSPRSIFADGGGGGGDGRFLPLGFSSPPSPSVGRCSLLQ